VRPETATRHWWAVADPVLAAAFTAAAFVPGLGVVGAQIGDLPRGDTDALAVLLVLGQTVPLAVRTRWPAGCLALVGLCFAAHEALAYPPTVAGLGLYLALYSAGAHLEHHRTPVAAVAVAAYAGFAGALLGRGSPNTVPELLLFGLVLAAFWVLGAYVRRRRADEAERRRQAALLAVADERTRMARELHDVVTHHVTAMVVQADATRFASAEQVAPALESITGTGRRALVELRFLLGVLEATGAAAPDLDGIARLVEQTREGGQPVELVEEGTRPPLPVEAELTAYRVVQECLTNAVKYAAGLPTAVRLGHRPGRLEVEVTTDGSATGAGDLGSGRRGLAGLAERVAERGGELTVDEDGGRFRVRAVLPTEGI
jgi:signal transduction histidine kinase